MEKSFEDKMKTVRRYYSRNNIGAKITSHLIHWELRGVAKNCLSYEDLKEITKRGKEFFTEKFGKDSMVFFLEDSLALVSQEIKEGKYFAKKIVPVLYINRRSGELTEGSYELNKERVYCSDLHYFPVFDLEEPTPVPSEFLGLLGNI